MLISWLVIGALYSISKEFPRKCVSAVDGKNFQGKFRLAQGALVVIQPRVGARQVFLELLWTLDSGVQSINLFNDEEDA